jgi:hypothetical protein
MGGVKMFGCVLILRRVTAADVAARETQAKMNPSVEDLQTLFATVRSAGNFVDLIQVGAS